MARAQLERDLEHGGGTLRACRKSICLDRPKRPMIFVNVISESAGEFD